MLYFPTVSVIRDPGYFNIWTDAFENIWNYFLRIETQKWFKIFVFWWTLDSSMYCFPSWTHNVTGNVSESSFYCRNFWEIFHSGNGDSGWPDDCLWLVFAFQPPDFWSYVLLLRKSMKITRLPGSFPPPTPASLSSFYTSLAVHGGPWCANHWIYLSLSWLWGALDNLLGLFSSLASYCMAALPGQATGEKRVGTGMCRVLLGMKAFSPSAFLILQSSNGLSWVWRHMRVNCKLLSGTSSRSVKGADHFLGLPALYFLYTLGHV